MIAIKLSAVVGKDRKLVLDLPKETPTRAVEVIIQSPPPTLRASSNPAREAARAKLAAAGLLSTTHHLPEGTVIPTDTEVLAAGQLPPGSRPSETLISEDRDDSCVGYRLGRMQTSIDPDSASINNTFDVHFQSDDCRTPGSSQSYDTPAIF